MKNVINYFYNLYPEMIYENNDIYYFFIEDEKFYFLICERPTQDIDEIIKISNALFHQKILVHSFILNKDNSYYTKYNKKNYILLKVNTDETEKLDLIDIVNFNNSLYIEDPQKLFGNDLVTRWKNMIDIYEEQMIEYNKEYPLLTGSFNYYIGLAENAISYANLALENKSESNIVLSHKRIKYPLLKGNFYNPLTFIFDYDIRDISEYIKSSFFNDNFDFYELENLLSYKKFNRISIILLYSRLLYPTYYFDTLENIISGDLKEKEILNIINKTESYEYFLFNVFNYLNKIELIPEIEWITSNKEFIN